MRRVIMFNMMSLDGFFARPDGDLDWHNVDEEFQEFAIEQTGDAGALLFGRVTYEMMASFWPSQFALDNDPIVAKIMNTTPKFVFSRTLAKADWSNTTLARGDAAAEVAKLKQQPGKDLFLFGSADLAATLIPYGLIDEYRIMVNPIILGKGRPLFTGIEESVKLRLLKTRTFENGNILLYYAPETKESR